MFPARVGRASFAYFVALSPPAARSDRHKNNSDLLFFFGEEIKDFAKAAFVGGVSVAFVRRKAEQELLLCVSADYEDVGRVCGCV